ncbi:MAG: glutamate 5-kinase [Chlamydiales bacterium]
MKKKIVVKLGSSSLTNEDCSLSRQLMVEIVRQVGYLYREGHQIVLVSSGAVAAGRELLSLAVDKTTLERKQMLASIGQVRLMQAWGELFRIYDIAIGQILLTWDNIADKVSAINAQNTLLNLLAHGIVPIVNENDTVATEEFHFGDNDTLSAQVAHLIKADWLILLTDQEGLLTSDPRLNPEAKLIETIEHIDETMLGFAQDSSHPNSLGKGGMASKVKAARFATESGINAVIASSRRPNVLLDVIEGKKIGTLFQSKLKSS